MNYHLDLVGLRTVLCTPEEITVSDRLRPFLTKPREHPECTITIRPEASLPDFAAGGVWHGPQYYDRHEDTMRIFHCAAPGAAAFAVTQLEAKGTVTLSVLPDYLSYFTGSSGIFNRISMETLLLQHEGLLLHASLIEFAGKAIAFSGPSGVGKSTQAALWHSCLGADILNGDRAALRKTRQGWFAYGSPYAGTSGIYRRGCAPLTALVILRQAKENRLRVLTPTQALRHIFPELSIHHWDRAFVEKATDLCLSLLQDTPMYLLECLPEESAARLLKKGLAL